MSGRPPRWVLILVCMILLTAGVVALVVNNPGALDSQDSKIKLVHATLLLSVFLLPTVFYREIKASQMLKGAAIWLGIGLVVFTAYAYREDADAVFQRLAGELMPKSAQVSGASNTIRVGLDGHFAVEARVNGVLVNFLIDTGASDVVLSPKDAERLGFRVEDLNYSKIYRTANGQVRGAPVRLDEISIGSIQVRDIRASVNGAEMNRSLLGMSFLERLSAFQINGNSLTMIK